LTQLVWVDAICINQKDDQEKSRQAGMMHNIHQKAQRVVIWLGEEHVMGHGGFNLAKSLYQKCNGASYDVSVTTFDFGGFDCKSKGVPGP
jgi:hypothetical protein